MRKVTLTIFVFFLIYSSCSEEKCASISCLNGGVCIDGNCQCPEGYVGLDCAEKLTPTKILLKKIKVVKFPETFSTQDWDSDSPPDIYVEVEARSLLFRSQIIENASYQVVHEFVPSSAIEVFLEDLISNTITVSLYDDDAPDLPQFMIGIFCKIYEEESNFPETLEGCTADGGYGLFSFTLEVDYVF